MAKESKVTRIKANDTPAKKSTPKEGVVVTDKKQPKVKKAPKAKSEKKNIFQRIGGYFKGAWQELRVVRWPTRQATWGLTLAVLIFSAFFVVLILALDAFFKFLFQLIIG